MADQARVTSVEAIEQFRTNLIIFATKARARLDEVHDEIRRTRAWIQGDRRLFWETQVRKRQKVLDQAQQELLSARISDLRNNLQGQNNAVRKAQHALDQANDRLRNVKRWMRDYESTMEPLAKQLEGLRRLLDDDIPKGIALLSRIQQTLGSYSEVASTPSAVSTQSTEKLPE